MGQFSDPQNVFPCDFHLFSVQEALALAGAASRREYLLAT
jgi:hypothetical protein